MPEKDKQQMFLEVVAKICALAAEIEQRQIGERDPFGQTKGLSHLNRFLRQQ